MPAPLVLVDRRPMSTGGRWLPDEPRASMHAARACRECVCGAHPSSKAAAGRGRGAATPCVLQLCVEVVVGIGMSREGLDLAAECRSSR